MEWSGTRAEELPAESGDGLRVFTWTEGTGWENARGKLAVESAITVFLDGMELATLMCTSEKLNFLVAGFLCSEGVIDGLDDIAMMRVCDEESVVEVRLVHPREAVRKRIVTSGCGGGIALDDTAALSPVGVDFGIAPDQVLTCMRLLQQSYASRDERQGMHLSALSDGQALLVVARDIGRHNTLDKIWGECLFRDIRTEGRILLTTGRLSSEMVVKAARMGVPVTVSLNSPTLRAVRLAEKLGIAVVGYARGSRLSVYSQVERLYAFDRSRGV